MSFRTLAAVALSAAMLVGCGAPTSAPSARTQVGPSVGWGAQPSDAASQTPTPTALELPRGGREVFPRYRLFGYSGYPGAAALGRLGIGDIEERMVEMEQRGQAYRDGRELMPVMELIATMVHPRPGKDGLYRSRVDDAVIQKWLDVARKHKGMLLLNIQPGRADFLDEVKHFEKWLKEPDVGLALDPEWAVDAGQVPGRVFGNTSGKELNDCAEYAAKLVAEHNLPEKVVLYHQLHVQIVRNETDLKEQPGIVLVKSIDGIGSYKMKVETYDAIVKRTPAYVHKGFKLFYVEDTRGAWTLMTPQQTMGLTPPPEYVLFE